MGKTSRPSSDAEASRKPTDRWSGIVESAAGMILSQAMSLTDGETVYDQAVRESETPRTPTNGQLRFV